MAVYRNHQYPGFPAGVIMVEDFRKKLLLVEDEALIGFAEKIGLEKFGYDIKLVTNGMDAINSINDKEKPDLVLMDIDLGNGIDGTSAAEIILKNHNIPIVFLSSHDEPEIIQKTEKISSYGLITKSSSMTVIDSSIKMSFRLFEAYKELQEKERRFMFLFENLTDAFAVHKIVCDEKNNPVDYMFIEVNQVMLNRVNKTREEMIGHTAKELFPRTEKDWIDAFGRVALTGKSEVVTHYSVELDKSYEARIYCPQIGFFAALFIDLDEKNKQKI